MAEVTYRKAEARFDGGRTYDVLVDGDYVGQVHSRREDSWRTFPSGVRYSLKGRPQFWSYSGDERAYLYRRKDATKALLRSIEEDS